MRQFLPPCRLSACSLAALRGSGAGRARGPSRHAGDGVEKKFVASSARDFDLSPKCGPSCASLQHAGKSVGPGADDGGPCMRGHLSLVRRAKSECDVVVATIFVNPTQFRARMRTFSKYPADAGIRSGGRLAAAKLRYGLRPQPPGKCIRRNASTFVESRRKFAQSLEGVFSAGAFFRGVRDGWY